MVNKGYNNGRVIYPTSIIDHKKSSQTPEHEDITELKEWKEQQESAIPDDVIKGIKEVENFLAGSPDTETLANLLSALTDSLSSAIAAKYSKPSSGIPKTDLDTAVQSSLALADSALQQHQSLDNYYEKVDSNTLAAIMSLSTLSAAGTTTVTTNPEWQIVYIDGEDKILLGMKQDGTWYTPIPLSDVLDTLISGLSTS